MSRILVIGAGNYQIPIIKRIRELGHEAFCVDKNDKAPGFAYADGYFCVDVCDKDECLQYAEDIGAQGVVTLGATITQPTVAFIAKKLGLPGLNAETAELSKNKYLIKKCLSRNGCNIYGQFFASDDYNEIITEHIKLPCVIKPSDGSGSKGVSVVLEAKELNTALKYAFASARYGEIYIESYISGEEYSVEAFVGNGEIYVYAIVKTTFYRDERGYIQYGHRTPSGLPEVVEHKIEQEICKAIKALNINLGCVNFDVILSNEDEKPYIIDVGIRNGQNLLSSHLVPLSRGIDVIDSTIRLAIGENIDLTPKYKRCIATRLLIYSPGVIHEIKPFSHLIGTNNIVDIVLRKNVGDVLRPYQDKSDTCGWVITDGASPEEAEKAAQAAKDLLEEYFVIS